MKIRMHKKSSRAASLAVLCTTLLVTSMPGYADPPPWAPAHGWRKQHDPNYQGYTGQKWNSDYGVVTGHCATPTVTGVLGNGDRNNNAIATILGAALGAIIDSKFGRNLEPVDRACIGHSLELVGDKKKVNWVNPNTNVAYALTPLRSDGKSCRDFRLKSYYKGRSNSTTGTACRTGDTWQFKQ